MNRSQKLRLVLGMLVMFSVVVVPTQPSHAGLWDGIKAVWEWWDRGNRDPNREIMAPDGTPDPP